MHIISWNKFFSLVTALFYIFLFHTLNFAANKKNEKKNCIGNTVSNRTRKVIKEMWISELTDLSERTDGHCSLKRFLRIPRKKLQAKRPSVINSQRNNNFIHKSIKPRRHRSEWTLKKGINSLGMSEGQVIKMLLFCGFWFWKYFFR